MADEKSLLCVRDLSTGYGSLQVLWNIAIDVFPQEAVCIIGSNGAGKSTLMQVLIGVHRPWTGRIEFSGADITKSGSGSRVASGIALVPEGRQLFYALTVQDNLSLGAYARRDKDRTKRTLEFIYESFPVLRKYRRRLVGSLSGGEQQMCAIGRALMGNPTLMLIDELSLGLAPVIIDDLIDLLGTIRREQSLSILLVEQDVGTALDITTRGYVLETGRIVLADTNDALRGNEHVKAAYLGI